MAAAGPTCARHGVLRGQIDISARIIWILEKLDWTSNVRWTNPSRLVRLTTTTDRAARGEVDMCTSPLLKNQLLPHIWGTVTHVIVDLTEVEFLTAAGLTVLVNARQTAVAAGSTLRLVASTRPVLLLTITRLDDTFDISPNLTHALLHPGRRQPHASR